MGRLSGARPERISDEEIRAILAFIKSTWPERQRGYQAAISAQESAP